MGPGRKSRGRICREHGPAWGWQSGDRAGLISAEIGDLMRTAIITMALVWATAGSALAGEGSDPGTALSGVGELRSIVAVAGDASAQADARIRALNAGMRANYARTLAQVSARLDPVLVVQFDGVGGTFNLRDGDRFLRVQPVPVGYELAKGVAHVPLDIHVILAPYLRAPAGGDWQVPLAATGVRIRAALEDIAHASLSDAARADATIVLTASLAFVEDVLARRNFSEADYMAYTARIFEAVGALRAYATDIQLRAIIAQLDAWRDEMGPARWRDLSAAIVAPHTLSRETAVGQVLRRMMDPERVERRLITLGGDFGNDFDTAVSVFGRLYIDGLAARLVFAQDKPLGQEMTLSLSTSRDLMAVPARETLERLFREREAAAGGTD